jgi:hypothetical protein
MGGRGEGGGRGPGSNGRVIPVSSEQELKMATPQIFLSQTSNSCEYAFLILSI